MFDDLEGGIDLVSCTSTCKVNTNNCGCVDEETGDILWGWENCAFKPLDLPDPKTSSSNTIG